MYTSLVVSPQPSPTPTLVNLYTSSHFSQPRSPPGIHKHRFWLPRNYPHTLLSMRIPHRCPVLSGDCFVSHNLSSLFMQRYVAPAACLYYQLNDCLQLYRVRMLVEKWLHSVRGKPNAPHLSPSACACGLGEPACEHHL